jgi:hypothetical protein
VDGRRILARKLRLARPGQAREYDEVLGRKETEGGVVAAHLAAWIMPAQRLHALFKLVDRDRRRHAAHLGGHRERVRPRLQFV